MMIWDFGWGGALLLLVALALIARPARPIGRGAGALLLALVVLCLAAVVHLAR